MTFPGLCSWLIAQVGLELMLWLPITHTYHHTTLASKPIESRDFILGTKKFLHLITKTLQ